MWVFGLLLYINKNFIILFLEDCSINKWYFLSILLSYFLVVNLDFMF